MLEWPDDRCVSFCIADRSCTTIDRLNPAMNHMPDARRIGAISAIIVLAACSEVAGVSSAPESPGALRPLPTDVAAALDDLATDALDRLAPAVVAGEAGDEYAERDLVHAWGDARAAALCGDARAANSALDAVERALVMLRASGSARGAADRTALALHVAALRRSLETARAPQVERGGAARA